MRYVIVSTVFGQAGMFNEKLKKEVCKKFNVKASVLPAHFTIKAPFEYDGDISSLETLLYEFCKNNHSEGYKLEGYNHFDDRVIYMQVFMSEKAKNLHDRLIDAMNSLDYINFKQSEGKEKIFHVTIASKKVSLAFEKAYDYVNEFPYSFDCKFDNITVYKWQNNTWALYKKYKLK